MLHRKKSFIRVQWVQSTSPLRLMDALIDPNTINAILPIHDVEDRCLVFTHGVQMQIAEDMHDFYLRIAPLLGEQFERDDQ